MLNRVSLNTKRGQRFDVSKYVSLNAIRETNFDVKISIIERYVRDKASFPRFSR